MQNFISRKTEKGFVGYSTKANRSMAQGMWKMKDILEAFLIATSGVGTATIFIWWLLRRKAAGK